MNTLARSVLTMYSYDENADDISLPTCPAPAAAVNSAFPAFVGVRLIRPTAIIMTTKPFYSSAQGGSSTPENFLHILRPDSSYTELEAKILDVALVLHAEHGEETIQHLPPMLSPRQGLTPIPPLRLPSAP